MLIKNTNRNKQLLNHIATEWRFFSKRIFQTPFLQSLVPVFREDYFCIFANQEKEPFFCPIKMEWKPFLRGPYKPQSSKVWFQLAHKFQRKILFILANQKQKGQYLPCFLSNQIKMRLFCGEPTKHSTNIWFQLAK